MLVFLVLFLEAAFGVVAQDGEAAGEHDEATCDQVPIIYCEGAWHSLYSNAGTPQQEEFWNTGGGGDDIVSDLQKLLPEFPKYIQNEEWDKIADILTDFVEALLSPIMFNSDGESVAELDGDINGMEQLLQQDHKADPSLREYDFNYDWREDPWVLAERFKNFLEQVCEKTGHSTVNVAAQSGSAVVFMAYLARYKDENPLQHIRAITVRATLHKGSTVFGDLVNKRWHIDSEALATTGFLRDFSVPNHEEISNMLLAADKTGLLKALLATVNRAWPRILDRLYERAFVPYIMSLPMLWAYVPDEDYESGKEVCFGTNRGKYVNLIQKLDRYHYNVAVKADELLKDAAQKIRVGLYLGTNSPLFPLVENARRNSDGFVDTTLASLGATVAEPFGKKLGVFGIYKQKLKSSHNYVSPDNTIDASTCLLRDYTWFISDRPHIGGTNKNFAHWFFDSRKTQTVFSDPNYPQYLVFDDEQDIFVPQDEESFLEKVGTALNPVDRIKGFFYGIINFFITLGTWWID
jgi:hypothetical protein